MNGKGYPEEFKIEAAKQAVDRGHSIASVATRLDITIHSLYARVKSTAPIHQRLKRERIKKKIYGTREEARSDVFDYIEMFYTCRRRHGSRDQMPPAEYEKQYYQRLGVPGLSVAIH